MESATRKPLPLGLVEHFSRPNQVHHATARHIPLANEGLQSSDGFWSLVSWGGAIYGVVCTAVASCSSAIP